MLLFVKSFLDILGKANPLSMYCRGIKLGITEKEIGIKIDSILNVYGEILFDM